mgnify:CR=1 FL=1
MFTGIIEEVGTVKQIQKNPASAVITIAADTVLEQTKIGDSIAVNGVCLTVTDLKADSFTADVMHETLRRSSLGSVRTGSPVNLERAMQLGGRFGGHIVTGHIDGTGTICEVISDEIAICYSIKAPEKIMHYIVEKGSVAVDGISLTIAETAQTTFMVSVIPHTAQCTVLSNKKAGDTVNLENDCIGKYIEHFWNWEKEKTTESKITKEFLFSNGF